LFGSDNGLNNPISITAGGVSASGSSGTTPLHPAGAFTLTIDTAAGTASAAGTNLNLLNGQPISVGATVSITYSTFRTRNPTCTLIGGIPFNLPLGNADITSLLAAQQPGNAVGTLTPAGGGSWTYTIPMIVDVTPTVSFNGAPVPVDPTPVLIVLTGTVTPTGATAVTTATTTLTNQQTQPGPFELDPVPFDDPLCTSHLIVNIVLASTTFNISSNASISASGVLVPQGCDTIDFNGDGLFPDTQDIADFIAVFGGAPCPTGPTQCGDIDFNSDGLFPDVADIESLVRVFGGGPC
ncbi:MAG TPA: hypothetical protein VHN77_14165, partial [Phycisphaerales bacterium]|nr:hypothetical protein [Phycisphaerales bacterium]